MKIFFAVILHMTLIIKLKIKFYLPCIYLNRVILVTYGNPIAFYPISFIAYLLKYELFYFN